MHRRTMVRSAIATIVGGVLAMAAVSPAWAGGYGAWGTPTNAELAIPGTSSELNTAYTDGCPILSPDGLRLFMASNRPGGPGGLDIWVARRSAVGKPWGAPVALPAPVNSAVDDFCPTPVKGGGLFFVSARVVTGACGGADIYVTRFRDGAWLDPSNLGCQVNSAAGEAGPSLVPAGHTPTLYFSSTRPGGFTAEAPGATSGDSDIYASRLTASGFGAAVPVPGLNSAGNDARPNVRHDGLEIVFDSDRPGTLGGPDIYAATRRRLSASWSAPANLGPTINTPSSESRASFSWDGTVMVFGSTRPGSEAGSNDIYVSVRRRT
jgi:hypothetical protein